MVDDIVGLYPQTWFWVCGLIPQAPGRPCQVNDQPSPQPAPLPCALCRVHTSLQPYTMLSTGRSASFTGADTTTWGRGTGWGQGGGGGGGRGQVLLGGSYHGVQ